MVQLEKEEERQILKEHQQKRRKLGHEAETPQGKESEFQQLVRETKDMAV